MPYFIFSPEAIPDPELQKRPGYTPVYITFAGQSLPPLEANKWTRLPDEFDVNTHESWKDKRGTKSTVRISDFRGVIASTWAERGIIFLDHEPSAKEKEKLEPIAQEENLKFRRRQIEFFEQERSAALARQGRYEVTPYVDECYSVLKMEKPYSIAALRAARHPGEEAAIRIADAIANALKDKQPAATR